MNNEHAAAMNTKKSLMKKRYAGCSETSAPSGAKYADWQVRECSAEDRGLPPLSSLRMSQMATLLSAELVASSCSCPGSTCHHQQFP